MIMINKDNIIKLSLYLIFYLSYFLNVCLALFLEVHNWFWRCRIDSNIFGCCRVELILSSGLILFEDKICSFW